MMDIMMATQGQFGLFKAKLKQKFTHFILFGKEVLTKILIEPDQPILKKSNRKSFEANR